MLSDYIFILDMSLYGHVLSLPLLVHIIGIFIETI